MGSLCIRQLAGFVSGGVLKEGEGTSAVAPMRRFEKLPQLQVGPLCDPG